MRAAVLTIGTDNDEIGSELTGDVWQLVPCWAAPHKALDLNRRKPCPGQSY
jgi:hypothetical protein